MALDTDPIWERWHEIDDKLMPYDEAHKETTDDLDWAMDALALALVEIKALRDGCLRAIHGGVTCCWRKR